MFFGPSLIALIWTHANGRCGDANCNEASGHIHLRFDVLHRAFGWRRTATGVRFELSGIEYDEVVDKRRRLWALTAAAFKNRVLGAIQRGQLQNRVPTDHLCRFNASIWTNVDFQLHVSHDPRLPCQRGIDRRRELRHHNARLRRLARRLNRSSRWVRWGRADCSG